MVYTNCYACGQDGHVRAECPRRTNARRTKLPAPPPAAAGAGKMNEITAPMPASAKSADYSAKAQEARQAMAKTGFGHPPPLHPPGFLAREIERWNVRGEPRTRATFSQPHPADFPGGLPIPPECPLP